MASKWTLNKLFWTLCQFGRTFFRPASKNDVVLADIELQTWKVKVVDAPKASGRHAPTENSSVPDFSAGQENRHRNVAETSFVFVDPTRYKNANKDSTEPEKHKEKKFAGCVIGRDQRVKNEPDFSRTQEIRRRHAPVVETPFVASPRDGNAKINSARQPKPKDDKFAGFFGESKGFKASKSPPEEPAASKISTGVASTQVTEFDPSIAQLTQNPFAPLIQTYKIPKLSPRGNLRDQVRAANMRGRGYNTRAQDSPRLLSHISPMTNLN